MNTDNNIINVLAATCAVKILAKDLHYRAEGDAFYGEHLLADLISDADKANDDLIETFFMGQEGKLPPPMWQIHSKGVALAARGMADGEGRDGDAVLRLLIEAVDRVVQAVEDAKKNEVTGGVSAVLDDVSKRALTAKALLSRTACEGMEVNVGGVGALVNALSSLTKSPATDAGTSEGAKKGWEKRRSAHSAFHRAYALATGARKEIGGTRRGAQMLKNMGHTVESAKEAMGDPGKVAKANKDYGDHVDRSVREFEKEYGYS